MPAADSRVRSRKSRPPGTKMSFWLGRSAPPDSTREITGSRFCFAMSLARKIFRIVQGLLAPPRTVGSFATIMHSTPSTTPMPATTLPPSGYSVPMPPAGRAPGTARRGQPAARSVPAARACPGNDAWPRPWARPPREAWRRWHRARRGSPAWPPDSPWPQPRQDQRSSAGRSQDLLGGEFFRDVHNPGAQQLTKVLGLRIKPRVIGDTLAEQAAHDHVDRAKVGQDVAFKFELRGFGQQRAHRVQGECLRQPRPRPIVFDPDTQIGVATLIPAAGGRDPPERRPPGAAVTDEFRHRWSRNRRQRAFGGDGHR